MDDNGVLYSGHEDEMRAIFAEAMFDDLDIDGDVRLMQIHGVK